MRPTFNSPESIAAGEYYVSLVPFLPPGHLTMASGAATAMFAEGNVALQVEFFGRGLTMSVDPEKSKVADKTSFAPDPTGPDKSRPHASIHTGNGVALYSLSKNMNAAYKVLELAMSPRIMKKVFLEKYAPFGWVVPRPSVLRDPEVVAKAPFLEKAATELLDPKNNYYFFLPALPEYPQAMDIAGTALSKAFQEEHFPFCELNQVVRPENRKDVREPLSPGERLFFEEPWPALEPWSDPSDC